MSRNPLPIGFALALALAAPVRAQDATANGTITESGRPVAGAAVTIEGADDKALTDQDGRYTATVPAGSHKISVALHGYKPVEMTATLEKDKTTTTDIALEPLLQIQSLTVPASLAQGAEGKATLAVKNTATTAYSIDAAGLTFLDATGKDQSANFNVKPDAANPAAIQAGETATLNFSVTPTAAAAAGKLTVRANLLTFDTALGKNLIQNTSFEAGDADQPEHWVFAGDNTDLGADFSGHIVTDSSVTGGRSAQIIVGSVDSGDVRFYWTPDPWVALTPGKSYVLSGYVKTDNVVSDPGFGASVYIPVVGDNPYQQPNSPWVTGTRDWRKGIVAFNVAEDATNPQGVPRGEIQQGSGTAWFDNLSLTEGTEDGSLTLTGGDQSLEVTKP
jgi:carboxypeptidase family protein